MNKPIIFNPEIRLSEHFRLGEFTKSITAERLRIVNEPGYEQILALRWHCATSAAKCWNLCANTTASPSASPAAIAVRH